MLDYPFVNAAGGLELFDLQHFETIWVRGGGPAMEGCGDHSATARGWCLVMWWMYA